MNRFRPPVTAPPSPTTLSNLITVHRSCSTLRDCAPLSSILDRLPLYSPAWQRQRLAPNLALRLNPIMLLYTMLGDGNKSPGHRYSTTLSPSQTVCSPPGSCRDAWILAGAR